MYCEKSFVIPVCRDHREHCCSSECKANLRKHNNDKARLLRKRNCLSCGKIFYPRNTQIVDGQGKYCSIKCSTKNLIVAAHNPISNAKRTESFMKTMNGNFRSGENHPQWKGGKKETSRRLIESGLSRARLKNYRAKNPEKVIEWNHRRRASKEGQRIEYGFYKKLVVLQKNKCTICRSNLGNKYHVDHIYPLAKGGAHDKYNIQLLCQSCNVRKWAKDPIDFMNSRGFLL